MSNYVGVTSPSSNCQYPISNSVCYQALASTYQKCLAAYSAEVEPKSFSVAAKDPKWVAAMQQEIQALEDNQTSSIVSLPLRKHPIGCKWILKIKYKALGEVERYKARLVTKGYTQNEGLDYIDTFSLVAKMVTVISIIAVQLTFDGLYTRWISIIPFYKGIL
ncbi:putative mitochondrial protein AtMg00820 [Nicotiana tabacum]|uniref:Mitochondrial protein AtMg00820 n=1 Tax=Nicotiana tabacum TaxID=4097 RepID=A0AC58SI08_TOBAC